MKKIMRNSKRRIIRKPYIYDVDFRKKSVRATRTGINYLCCIKKSYVWMSEASVLNSKDLSSNLVYYSPTFSFEEVFDIKGEKVFLKKIDSLKYKYLNKTKSGRFYFYFIEIEK